MVTFTYMTLDDVNNVFDDDVCAGGGEVGNDGAAGANRQSIMTVRAVFLSM